MIIRHNKKAILLYLVFTLGVNFALFYIWSGWSLLPFLVLGYIFALFMALLLPFLVMCLTEKYAIAIENGLVKFSPAYGSLSFELNQVESVKLKVKQGYMHQVELVLKHESEWKRPQKALGRFHIWLNRKFAGCTVVIASSLLAFNPFKLEEALKEKVA